MLKSEQQRFLTNMLKQPHNDDRYQVGAIRFERHLNLSLVLKGPEGSPYEGGFFSFKINGSSVKCMTRIFHPNFSSRGHLLKPLNIPETKNIYFYSKIIEICFNQIKNLLLNPIIDE